MFVWLKFQQICVLLVAKLQHAARVRADTNFARYINGVQVNGTGTCTWNLSLTEDKIVTVTDVIRLKMMIDHVLATIT